MEAMSLSKKSVGCSRPTSSNGSPQAGSSALRADCEGELSPSVSFRFRTTPSPSSVLQPTPANYSRAFLNSSQSNSGSGSSQEASRAGIDVSESLCNFAESTPCRVDVRGITPFPSDEHGVVAGSPLSSYSGIGLSNASNRFAQSDKRVMNAASGISYDASLDEASLLVSPRRNGPTSPNRDVERTPSTLRRQTTPANTSREYRGFESRHSEHTDHHAGTAFSFQRDPTPLIIRSKPLTSPHGIMTSSTPRSYLTRSAGSNRSDNSSRSGRDPPAKSPFPHSSTHHTLKTASHHTHVHYEDLSMIDEDCTYADQSTILNQSHVSNVTALTAPQTPLARKVQHDLNTESVSGGVSSGGGTPVSSEMLLRRPSQAMRESLSQIATQTSHQLEDIWDVVGVSPEERAKQMADLIEKISSICEEKIAEERGLEEQFRKEILGVRKEWEESCRALRLGETDSVGLKRDPSAINDTFDSLLNAENEGVSLQSQYEEILGRLENIRSMIAEASSDIQSSQSRIFEAYAVLNGCGVEEAARSHEMEPWSDVTSDLTQTRRDMFSVKADEMEETVATRTKAIVSLLRDCQHLIRELKIVPPGCLSEEEKDTGDYGPGGADEVGRSEDDFKIMKSLVAAAKKKGDSGEPRSSGRRSASDYTIVSLFESSSCTGIGKETLDRLTSRLAELNGEKRRRRARLGEMGEAISALWSMLRIPADEQRAFTEGVSGLGLGLDTIRRGEQELVRLHELKAATVGKLIREQRTLIEDLWNRTNTSEKEKAAFSAYFDINDDDQLTDHVLAQHEEYVVSLKTKLEKMQPILDLIEKREAILADRTELENFQKDPERLKQRGASLTKQLMKEEKMNRRVKKELPKVTQMLERMLLEWYDKHRPSDVGDDEDPQLGHFIYQNNPYLRTIEIQEEEWRLHKEQVEQERIRKRQEERTASANAAFGSTYVKLPGKKWIPSTGTVGTKGSNRTNGPAGDRPRSASNVRGRPLADVQNVPRANSRPRNERDKRVPGGNRKVNSDPTGRTQSAPRMRI